MSWLEAEDIPVTLSRYFSTANRGLWAVVAPMLAVIVAVASRLIFHLELGTVLEITGVAVGVIATLFAAIQFVEAGKQLEKLEHQLKELGNQSRIVSDLKQQLSTQFVDSFPQNLTALTNFVSPRYGSPDVLDLDVMVDFAGYGDYSNYWGCKTYLEELTSRAKSSTIRLLVYGDELMKSAIALQWTEEKFREEAKKAERLKDFYLYHQQSIASSCKQEFASFDEFTKIGYHNWIRILVQVQKDIQTNLRQNANIQIRLMEGTKTEMIHCWIAKNDALFSLNVVPSQELCFKTADERMINSFREMFERSWDSSNSHAQAANTL